MILECIANSRACLLAIVLLILATVSSSAQPQLILPVSSSAQPQLTLSDTISFRSSKVGETSNRFGIGNWAIAAINHLEGKSIIYAPVGEFREKTLRREFYEYAVRHLNLDGSVTQGPSISRQFKDGHSHFDGARDWIAWTALEAPLGSEGFPQLITEVFDDSGISIARKEVLSYQSDLVELYDIKTATSRYGSYVVVAALTSRREDRLAPREEAGANLTVACIDADGEFVYRHQYDLPDLRARYTLEDVRIDGSQEAVVLLKRSPWRAMPATFEDPQIDLYEFLRVDAETKKFAPVEVLPKGYQPRGVFVLDQDPYPAGFAIAFASDLFESIVGFQLIHAGEPDPIQILLTRSIVDSLPEFAIESIKGAPKYINGQYAPTELQYSPDGRLFALYADMYRPLAFQDPAILQWRREPDSLSDGIVLVEIDFSEKSSQQRSYFLSLRQRAEDGFHDYDGACLVPVNGAFGILFNEDPNNLIERKRKRRPFTRFSFAKPFLAYLENDKLVREELDYITPYRFGVLAIPSAESQTNGKQIEFSAIEQSFWYSSQFFFWPNEFTTGK
ncbi:MAG: hypothetical protein AB8F78_13140 [Saprospiraceae bacterium]